MKPVERGVLCGASAAVCIGLFIKALWMAHPISHPALTGIDWLVILVVGLCCGLIMGRDTGV